MEAQKGGSRSALEFRDTDQKCSPQMIHDDDDNSRLKHPARPLAAVMNLSSQLNGISRPVLPCHFGHIL